MTSSRGVYGCVLSVMRDPPSLRKTSSFMVLFNHKKSVAVQTLKTFQKLFGSREEREYNLAAYDCRRDHHSSGCTAGSGGIAGRAGGDSFYSAGTQGRFLSDTPFLYVGRLAMAGIGADPIVVDRRIRFIRWTIRESTYPLSCDSTSGSAHGEPLFDSRPGR